MVLLKSFAFFLHSHVGHDPLRYNRSCHPTDLRSTLHGLLAHVTVGSFSKSLHRQEYLHRLEVNDEEKLRLSHGYQLFWHLGSLEHFLWSRHGRHGNEHPLLPPKVHHERFEKLPLHSRSPVVQVLLLFYQHASRRQRVRNHLLYGQPRPSHFRRLASLPNTLCQQSEPQHRHLLRQMPPRLSFQLHPSTFRCASFR